MLHRRRLPRLLLVLFLFVLLCGLIPTASLLYDTTFLPLWVRLVAPLPAARTAPQPHRLLSALSPTTTDFIWSADSAALTLFRSDWIAQNSDHGHYLRTVDLQTGHMSDEHYVLPDRPAASDILAQCIQQDLRVVYKQAADNVQTVVLWQHQHIVATFPFTSTQMAPHAYALDPAYASFSPDCRYVAVTLSGWLYYEQNARDELWLLDIPAQTFRPILLGRTPASVLWIWDYPVQTVRASWSPDSTKFVFGDNRFGMETYDIARGERRWFAGAENAGDAPRWSPSGAWIAFERSEAKGQGARIVVIASDGQQQAQSTPCHALVAWHWAPDQDQLAYICEEQQSNQYSLWLWDPAVPSNHT